MALFSKRDSGKPAGEERLKRALSSERGFTLTEALATVIIVGLVTCILASGIALATRQYTKSMATSEAQMLFTSLERTLDTELRFTDINTLVLQNGYVIGFDSTHYFVKENTRTPYLCVTDEKGKVKTDGNGYGYLAFGSSTEAGALTNPLLGTGSYNYGLEVAIPQITYDSDSGYFTVLLSISNDGGQSTLVSEPFTVRALNAQRTYSTGGGSGSGGSGSTGNEDDEKLLSTKVITDIRPSSGDKLKITSPANLVVNIYFSTGGQGNGKPVGKIENYPLNANEEAVLIVPGSFTMGSMVIEIVGDPIPGSQFDQFEIVLVRNS